MTINLQAIMRGNYVEISCFGLYHKEAFLDAISRSLDLGEDKGVSSVVLNIDNIHLGGSPPDTLERYYIGEKAAQIQLRHKMHIILAVVGKEPLIDPERFAETVAINRGADGKVFEEMDDALRWITNRISINNDT